MNYRTAICAVAAVALAGCAAAGPQTASMTQPPAAEAPIDAENAQTPAEENAATNVSSDASDDETVICKQQPPKIGSRLGAREVCATKKDWDQLKRDSRDGLEDLQRRTDGDSHGP